MTATNLWASDPGPALGLLSLGAGVQSTTVLLACEEKIPRFDVALFADTRGVRQSRPTGIHAARNASRFVACGRHSR